MFFAVDAATRRKGKSPHELAMINLLLFNLMIGIALLAGSMAPADSVIAQYKWVAVAVPLAVSLIVIGFTWKRASKAQDTMSWFAAAHWKLAASRYRLLLIGYLVCGAIVGFGLSSGGQGQASIEAQIAHLPPAMQEMERRKLEGQDMGGAVWARIGVVPLILIIMVSIMLESGALYQAGRGEVPDAMTKKLPPPADLASSDTEVPLED